MPAQVSEDPRVLALGEVSLQAFVAHRGGAIVYANAGFCALFGFEAPAQAVGAPLAPLLGDIAAFGANGEPLAFYGRRPLRRRDGRSFVAEFYARAVAWQDGPAVAIAITDVTHEEAALDAQAARRAESALRLKADANVARLVAFGRDIQRAGAGDDAEVKAAVAAAEAFSALGEPIWRGPRQRPLGPAIRVAASSQDRALLRGLEREGFEAIWIDPSEPAPVNVALVILDLEPGLRPPASLRAVLRGFEARRLPVAAIAPAPMHPALAESGVAALTSRPVRLAAFARTLRLLAGSVEAAEFDQVQQEDREDKANDDVDGEHGGPQTA